MNLVDLIESQSNGGTDRAADTDYNVDGFPDEHHRIAEAVARELLKPVNDIRVDKNKEKPYV